MYDAVVVGLGAVGSFALRSLAKQGKGGKFLGIERFSRGHAAASGSSSHGKTRIYSRACVEHANYVPWIDHSLKEIRDLEASSRESLMVECGSLVMDTATTPENPNQYPPLVQACYNSAQEHDIPVQVLNMTDLQERFPQFWYNHKSVVGIYEPHAGFLRPDRILEAALKDAEAQQGVEIMENTHVEQMNDLSIAGERGPIEIVIKRDDGQEDRIETRNLLVATGPSTGQLIPEWQPHLKVTRQVQGWIDINETEGDASLFDSATMPAWIMKSPDLPLPIYGEPCDTNGDPDFQQWLKIATHGRNVEVHDLANNPSGCSPVEMAELQMSTGRCLSTTGWRSPQNQMPNYAELQPCLYTTTKDTHFMIGTPAGYQSVFCVAGLSGHGFKMAPALGKMMADFALGQNVQEEWKTEFCSPSRFGV